MESENQLETISKKSDEELLHSLSELLQSSRHVEAELVAHIGEVDQRRLFAPGASSMFTYCTRVLHLSEHEAYLRIEVARAARKHPVLLKMLADGRLHLSGIALLHRHLTEGNCDAILNRATHCSKRQIEELVAELSPKADVPTTMRKLAERKTEEEANKKQHQLGPDRVSPPNSEPESNAPTAETAAATPSPPPAKPALVKPIAPERYKIVFTASKELRDKLERLRSLMRGPVPDGDLAAIIEQAVTEKLERLESKRFGKTSSPRKSLEQTDTSPFRRYIPAAVRRIVYERDQGQCRFVDKSGHRCTETERLEFHHMTPYGRGGDRSPHNIQLLCRTHNLYRAECDYGKDIVQRHRGDADRVSEPQARYSPHLDRQAARFVPQAGWP